MNISCKIKDGKKIFRARARWLDAQGSATEVFTKLLDVDDRPNPWRLVELLHAAEQEAEVRFYQGARL